MADTVRGGATLADLSAYSAQGQRCELVRGELIRLSPTGGTHGTVESRVNRVLGSEGEDQGLGLAMAGEVGILVSEAPPTVRGADNVFLLTAQLPYLTTPEGYLKTPPALVAEVLSPNDRASEVFEKVLEYLGAGVRVVWVVDPHNRVVTVYQSGQEALVLRSADRLVAPGVLDSLQAKVERLFVGLPGAEQPR